MESKSKTFYSSEDPSWYHFEGFSIRDCGPVDDEIKTWEDALGCPILYTYYLHKWLGSLTDSQLQDGIDLLEEKIMDPEELYSERLATLWRTATSIQNQREIEKEIDREIMEEVD